MVDTTTAKFAVLTAFVLLTGSACDQPVGGPRPSDQGEPRGQQDYGESDALPFGAAVVIIELTDNDIELQAFADGHWTRIELENPAGKRLFSGRSHKKLKQQAGVSEIFWASVPTHYLEDEPDFDGTIDEFLARFPAGDYEFEGVNTDGAELESVATLTHVLPALPEIVAPASDTDEPPTVDLDNLVIEWEPVTTRFLGPGSVDIVEYQVILDPIDERATPWVDGSTRRALINLPGDVTSLTVPPEYLLPNSQYDFEVLAIEASGNSTISVGEFVTGD